MQQNLHKNTKIIYEFLKTNGKDCEIREFSESTRTADEAASAIGCELAQIAKSLIFCGKKTKQPILIIASGINKVNLKSVETLLNEKISRPDANYVKEITGFPIGGVPPIAHKNKIKTFIDNDLYSFSEIFAAAGTPYTVFQTTAAILAELSDAKAISF